MRRSVGRGGGAPGATSYARPVADLTLRQRFAARISRSGVFRRFLGPKVFAKLDRWILYRTKGRLTAAGPPLFPTMVLTTVGARSGESRRVALVYLPDGDGAMVVASNFGRERHPAWSTNLLANAEVEVAAGGERWSGRARLLEAEEKAARWPELVAHMPAWDGYTKVTNRDLRVFALERA
jgi:deazaflavin-dependent oxidoreductase (nitroreductase family)